MNITDQTIEQLTLEAAQAGDVAQLAICYLALGYTPEDLRQGQGAEHIADAAPAGMTQAEARAECARVIEEAR